MNRPEILAPAGSIDSLKGAIKAGADAIYIGGRKFGARAYADNADENDLLEAIDFVHLNGKRIYMTVNTLLKETELEEYLFKYILPYYERGLDAVIVQDMGVLKFISENFPGLAIHGSTQMTVTQGAGAGFLEGIQGVTRVVPSRELSIDEVKKLRNETKLEIECFVHGALCFSYSGQCLFSSMIGGRSGNRGRCAQSCRQKYELLEYGPEDLRGRVIANNYAMSLKDMCSLENIPALVEAGIDSFKIEGRMKRPEYTAEMAAVYSYLTDKYCSLGKNAYEKYLLENPHELEDRISRARELYNRGGFSKGYYPQYHGADMLANERPNHTGVCVGTVSDFLKREVSIKLNESVYAGDLLEVRPKNGDSFEFTVGKANAEKRFVQVVAPKDFVATKGDAVYRTKNEKLLSEIAESYLTKPAKAKVVGLFRAKLGENIELKVTGLGCEAIVYGQEATAAVSRSATAEEVAQTLRKTGESEFDFEKLEIELSENLFIAVGALKELRRQAFKALGEAVINQYRRTAVSLREQNRGVSLQETAVDEENCDVTDSGQVTDIVETVIRVNKENQLDKALQLIDEYDSNQTIAKNGIALYLDIFAMSFEELFSLADRLYTDGINTFVVLPHIFRKKEELKLRKALESTGYRGGIIINSLDEIGFVKAYSKEKTVSFRELRLSESMYVTNKNAKCFYREQGFDRYTASLELNEKELMELELSDCDFVIYGNIPVMYTAQCFYDNYKNCKKKNTSLKENRISLKDRMNAEFPSVQVCRDCMNIIYNSAVYSLVGTKELASIKARAFVLSFTTEDPQETERVLRCYFENKLPDGPVKYTRGHYKRGVE